MLRDPALQDLSRDHFGALNHVVQVRRVVERDRFARPAAEVLAAYAQFLRGDLQEHLREEEVLVSDLLPARMRDRMLREHQALRDHRVGEDDVAAAWRSAQLLQTHVRWEEDEAFPWLQEHLETEALERLRLRVAAYRHTHGRPSGPGRRA